MTSRAKINVSALVCAPDDVARSLISSVATQLICVTDRQTDGSAVAQSALTSTGNDQIGDASVYACGGGRRERAFSTTNRYVVCGDISGDGKILL